MSKRFGITAPFDDGPLHAQRRRYESLPDLGYTDIWSSEADGIDGFTPLAMAAAWAPLLRLGTAIIPAFTRGPAVIAQTVAALAEATPAGVACGVGSSSQVIVERWNGITFDRPFERVRDLVRFLRAAFTGAKVEVAYDTFTVDGFRLGRPPSLQPPILVAALRPAMLRLAATEADGTILNWVSAEDVKTAVGALAGVGTGFEVVARIMVAPIDDADRVRAFGRRLIAAYLTVPAYASAQEWLGRGDELRPMAEAWHAGDRKGALEVIPDRVVDDLIIHGHPAECRERLGRYVDNGVTTPVAALLPLGYDIDDALRAIAPAS